MFETINLPTSIYVWSIGLIIAVPLITIVLGEVIERLKRNNSRYTNIFVRVRTVLVPTIIVLVIVRHLFQIPADSGINRVVVSVLLMSSAAIGFSLFNTISREKDVKRWENRLPGLFKTVLRIAVIITPIYWLMGVWGIDLSQFVAALGVGSLVIALALQDTLSSIVSGVLLVVDKPFEVGDWVDVDGYKGQVMDISWRSTRLLVNNNDVVVIPNVAIIGNSIYNYTMGDEYVLFQDNLLFSFSYDDPPNKVKSVLYDLAISSDSVQKMPAPKVQTISFDDFAITYKLKYTVADYNPSAQSSIQDELLTRAYYLAERHGLSMPYPITVEAEPDSFAPDAAAIEAEAFGFLEHNPYLSVIPEWKMREVVREVEVVRYGINEVIMHEGQLSDGLYVIRSGEVALTLMAKSATELMRLTAGEIVGEMILMGKRSNLATCTAVSDTTLYRLPTDMINRIVTENKRFALQLNSLLEERFRTLEGGTF